jgi:murein L,D-transpeptidase YcbB/YkuD
MSAQQIRHEYNGAPPDVLGDAARALFGLFKGKSRPKERDTRKQGQDRLYDLAQAYQAAIKSGDPENIRKIEKSMSARELADVQEYAADNGMLTTKEKTTAYRRMNTEPNQSGLLGLVGASEAPKPVTFGDSDTPAEAQQPAAKPEAGFNYDTDSMGKGRGAALYSYQEEGARTEQAGLKPIQRMLASAGMYAEGADSSPDGYFGGDTLAAVKKFQTENGLEPSGVLDQETLNRLKLLNEPRRGRY